MTRVALIAALALALTACGGGSGASLHTLAKTRSCLLKNREVKLDRKLDFVASTATGGALHVKMPQNAATVVFGESVGDADNINEAYHRFRAKNVGIEDIIRQDKNTVILYRTHPRDEDLATIQNCLK